MAAQTMKFMANNLNLLTLTVLLTALSHATSISFAAAEKTTETLVTTPIPSAAPATTYTFKAVGDSWHQGYEYTVDFERATTPEILGLARDVAYDTPVTDACCRSQRAATPKPLPPAFIRALILRANTHASSTAMRALKTAGLLTTERLYARGFDSAGKIYCPMSSTADMSVVHRILADLETKS